eukprot:m.115234 g.115234  ORF g.115234 m.115234 type:complete len:85 (-) comp28409_c0_seq1:232-486(-)
MANANVLKADRKIPIPTATQFMTLKYKEDVIPFRKCVLHMCDCLFLSTQQLQHVLQRVILQICNMISIPDTNMHSQLCHVAVSE